MCVRVYVCLSEQGCDARVTWLRSNVATTERDVESRGGQRRRESERKREVGRDAFSRPIILTIHQAKVSDRSGKDREQTLPLSSSLATRFSPVTHPSRCSPPRRRGRRREKSCRLRFSRDPRLCRFLVPRETNPRREGTRRRASASRYGVSRDRS